MSVRKRILLVNPRITQASRARFPLSLLALAGNLESRGVDSHSVDGNVESDGPGAVLAELARVPCDAVGVTVMGGPQVATAIEISRAVRARHPQLPIIWGGYFPSLYPAAAINAEYVDYLIRGQGEDATLELMAALDARDPAALGAIAGLTWRRDGMPVDNAARRFSRPALPSPLPYDKLRDPQRYPLRTFLGQRTVAHQAAIGCRFRCTFCGVAAMFKGATSLPPADRLDHELTHLRAAYGADSVQFFDHNFFDREEDTAPLLEVLARQQLPWWCYARADALVNLSPESWRLVRASKLRMAYIGAETPNNQLLKAIRKGTKADQTLEVAELCRSHGVIPELSFMVAPPEDPEGETERTFDFIRQVKRVNPDAEIIVYIYTPLPAASVPDSARLKIKPLHDVDGKPVIFPRTPEEWTERRWVEYSCHASAPWMSERLRRRVQDFVTVLRCRFPTVQDTRSPGWAKSALRTMAAWRYHAGIYGRPWELQASQNLIGLLDPRTSSL